MLKAADNDDGDEAEKKKRLLPVIAALPPEQYASEEGDRLLSPTEIKNDDVEDTNFIDAVDR